MMTLPLSSPAAAAELIARRTARTRLEHFAVYTKPDYDLNWHHRVLCQYLDRLVTGEITRLMVFMPPRHGKSELVSRRLPAYVLGRDPDTSIIACSYGADLASRMNRDVQRIIDDPRYHSLFPDTELSGKNIRTVAHGSYLRNNEMFEVVGRRGVYRSAGIGGAITGLGCHLGIIDDPVKNRQDADSEAYRDGVWEWYTSTFYTRLEKDARVLITLTRWHEDDLAGRLLAASKSDPDADQWTVINYPAIMDGKPALDSPEHESSEHDVRVMGDPLWERKYDRKTLAATRANVGGRDWQALFQGRPTAPEGGMFQRAWFTQFVDAAPIDAQRIRYWDKAATDGDGDYSAGVLLARDSAGLIYVEDVVRDQWSAGQRNAVIEQTAEIDLHRQNVQTWMEQEGGSGGKESAQISVRDLARFGVKTETVSGSKTARAYSFAVQSEAGNVRIVRGLWNKKFIDELCAFPTGTNDDQVDAGSGAFNKLVGKMNPAKLISFIDIPQPQEEERDLWASLTA